MIGKAQSFSVLGIDAYRVVVEVDVGKGQPAIKMVGRVDGPGRKELS